MTNENEILPYEGRVNRVLAFERGQADITAHVRGIASKHHGYIHIDGFTSDVDLTAVEAEIALEELTERARRLYLPEAEDMRDACR